MLSRTVVSEPSGNLLEMHILRLHPKPAESETLELRPSSCLEAHQGMLNMPQSEEFALEQVMLTLPMGLGIPL